MDTFTILTIALYLMGAVQGIVFGAILWTSNKHNPTANKFLAALLFLFSYRLLMITMRLFELGYYDIYYYFMVDLNWAIGPLLFFYVKALTQPQFRFSRTDWKHFIPVLFQVSFSVFVRLQNLYWDGTRESLTWLGYWGYAAWMNYPTIYIVASFLIILYASQAQQLLQEPLDKVKLDPARVSWIKKILLSFRIYFALVFIVLLVDFVWIRVIGGSDYWYSKRFYYYPFFSGTSILVYWLGIEGFKRKDYQGLVIQTEIPAPKRTQLENISHELNTVMEEQKLYTNPDLSLALLAEELNIKPYLLSKCLKEIYQSKFNDYINSLRVEEVRNLLQDPENEKYTLLSLAMTAGFNSKSSFNRAVKKHLGISPSELKASL